MDRQERSIIDDAGAPLDPDDRTAPDEATGTLLGTRPGRASLSTVPAGAHDGRLAIALVILSAVLFVAAVPFVRVPLVKIPAFIPTYEAALAINDLITAVLLFGQFSRLRSRALMVLACGYLFSALLIIPHALTFPDAFSPTGLLGAGDQTTAWLYVFWHAAFPLFIIAYALLRSGGSAIDTLRGDIRVIGAVSVALVVIAAGAFTLLATWGMHLLPVLIQQGNFSRLISTGTSPALLALCLVALAVLWRRRRHTVLDVWLMVVMCVWICDVTLSAVISSSRYDLGWYAGRTYGLFAASFVLVVLLLEMNGLHAKLAKAQAQLAERARDLERRVRRRTEDLRQSNDSLKLEVEERLQAEQELRRTRAFLDVVIESIPAMLLVKDARDGRCILLNRAGEELLGCDRKEIIGQNADDIMPIPDEKLIEQADQSASPLKKIPVYEHTLTTRKLGDRLVRTRKVPMRDEDGHEKYKLRFTDDITEQRQTRSEEHTSELQSRI